MNVFRLGLLLAGARDFGLLTIDNQIPDLYQFVFLHQKYKMRSACFALLVAQPHKTHSIESMFFTFA
jgi:hypothetical protein